MGSLLIVLGGFNIGMFLFNLVRVVQNDPTVSTFTLVMLPISLLVGVVVMLMGFRMNRRDRY